MKTTLFFLLPLFFLCAVGPALGQNPSTPSGAELIDQALSTFDLPPFEWKGEPDPPRPRLGIYFNAIPADSVAMITGKSQNDPWFVIWHVMPHWSADEAGILIGDTITAINGKAIGDGNYSGEDFVNLLVRDMQPRELARLSIRRNGREMELPVPLLTDERVPMSFTTPKELGPIRTDSWLGRTIRENDLAEWSREIQKQMRTIADIDMSRIRFAGRSNPWRLNAVTYLHNNPTRVGAYSRLIVDDLWERMEDGSNLAGAIGVAARHLDIPPSPPEEYALPSTSGDLTGYLKAIHASLTKAYGAVRDDLPTMTGDLAMLLDPDVNWETELDSIKDPRERRQARMEQEHSLHILFQKADRVDFAALADGAEKLAALADTTWLRSFAKQFEGAGAEPQGVAIPGVEGEIMYSWQTPLGTCIIGGKGPNRYSRSFPFILDLGGDDYYDLPSIPVGSSRFVADMGGNDLYTSSGSSQGAGIGGVDVLADLAGDDIYRADNFSQGAGLLGVGLLADYEGNDIYTAHWCAQGGAFLGIGVLYDGGGDDNYNADIYAQAFGYAKGFGTLLERGGNDSYRAGWKYDDFRYPNRAHLAMSQGFGFGMRPWSLGIGTDGGIGVLSDKEGDDLYASDLFSQGGSYWYALGVLHDGAGADRYTAGQYSQGSGIHLSFAALLEDGGDDMYDAYQGLEQGNAHDWSAGCLEDLSGNDTYRGSTISQGCAVNVAFAWLVDRSGDDRYYALSTDTSYSQGGGLFNRPRKHGSLGMLLDLGSGTDYYTDPRAVQGKMLFKGERGFLLDDGEKKD